MAKKRREKENLDSQRQSRREILRQRKLNEQKKQVRIGVAIVGGLLAIVFLVAIVNEFFVAPNRPVAVVQGENITLQEWQNRVRLERAQRVVLLENQLEAFGGDVGIIQQFSGQIMVDLQDADGLGQNVLNTMIDELVIRQAAAARGIMVTDEDVSREIGELYGYFGGGLPTPEPEPTETMMPTPSITPIPTQVITDVLPTTIPIPSPTAGPTFTPQPTATPVSEESFNEQYSEILTRLVDLGADEVTYRESVRSQIYRELLQEALVEETGLSSEAEHVSFYLLSYGSEEEANEAVAMIEADTFLNVWNEVRSVPFDPESTSTGSATEVVWRSRTALANSVSPQVADAVFALPLSTPSDLIVSPIDEETSQYFIAMVSGREIRPLSANEIQNAEQENLASFVSLQQVEQVELTGYDRGRVPTQPVLDPLFTQPPTPTPELVDPASAIDDGS
ncbi:MAG: hypothetical protein DWQ04_20840 [Chloroflexi bacterium]|nr:MAG: hypothetical protein DWQ04_20840 [Chloroflexota bacterium]